MQPAPEHPELVEVQPVERDEVHNELGPLRFSQRFIYAVCIGERTGVSRKLKHVLTILKRGLCFGRELNAGKRSKTYMVALSCPL